MEKGETMQGYYLFSDECGSYREERGKKFVATHPFYVRSFVLISFEDYIQLEHACEDLKKQLSIDMDMEIKWAEIGKRYKKKKTEESNSLSDETVFKYIESVISNIVELRSIRIFFSVFDNQITKRYKYHNILKMHIQNALQRAQMDVSPDGYVTMIIDDINEKINKTTKEVVHSMLMKGDFQPYTNIMKSILVDYSHHCVGLQLADYCVGVFTACLKSIRNPDNYKFARRLLLDYLYQKIRNNSNNIPFYEVYGYGVREVPNGCGTEICKTISRQIEDKLFEELNSLI